MGDGKGLVDDGVLNLEDLEDAATRAANSFGKAPRIFLNPQWVSGFIYHVNPEFEGLPWASKTRLSKRERKVAHLHMFLFKVGALKNMREQEHEEFVSGAIRRIKRARWAKYSTLAKQANNK